MPSWSAALSQLYSFTATRTCNKRSFSIYQGCKQRYQKEPNKTNKYQQALSSTKLYQEVSVLVLLGCWWEEWGLQGGWVPKGTNKNQANSTKNTIKYQVVPRSISVGLLVWGVRAARRVSAGETSGGQLLSSGTHHPDYPHMWDYHFLHFILSLIVFNFISRETIISYTYIIWAIILSETISGGQLLTSDTHRQDNPHMWDYHF